MAAQPQAIARQSPHPTFDPGMQQHQQQQQFEGGQPSFPMEQLRQQQMAQQKAQMQQRMAAEQSGQVGPGPQGPPGTLQMPPSYLQNQIMRQRQAAAQAAANWAAQQERSNGQNPAQTQRLGSAILRLLNYSEQLNSFAEPGNLDAWKRFVDEFYIDPALCTQSLPSDPELSYELPTPLLPAYFHQMHREVVKVNLTFHDAREYYLPPQNHVVECPKCTMCYYFKNLTKIEILGKLRIVFAPGPPPNFPLKMESWEFVGEEWDEWVCRIPPPPIKADGEIDRVGHDTDALMKDANGIDEAADNHNKGGSDNEDDNDEDDLFGRSPTASNQDPASRRSSKSEKVKTKTVEEENPKHTDPNKRARMVMPNGVTARHLRFLEISDVLGQLSPLFGKKSPKETLVTLLQSLPKLPSSDGEGEAGTQDKDGRASQSGNKVKPPPQKQGDRKDQTSTQKNQQVQAGRAMQQQAAQVLQKQAAQTLLQALPPDDLEFPDSSLADDAQDQDNGHHDDEDLFASNPSSDPLENAHHVKIEEMDEDQDGDAIEAELENEFGMINGSDDNEDENNEDDDNDDADNLDFGVAESVDMDVPQSGTKRASEESLARVKRQRNDGEY